MSEDIIYFSRKIAAKSDPTFIIEKDGRLYVTVGVLEYDPRAEGLSEEQKRGLEQIRDLFDSARDGGRLESVELQGGARRIAPVQTGPSPGPILNPRGGG